MNNYLLLIIIITIALIYELNSKYIGFRISKIDKNINSDTNDDSYVSNNNDSNKNYKETNKKFIDNKDYEDIDLSKGRKDYIPHKNYGGYYQDPVLMYDYEKIYNPLKEPTRRVSRSEMPPYYIKNIIDIPTQGYPDNYSLMGLLKPIDNGNNDEENKLYELYGRRKYPGSNKYEYYMRIPKYNSDIKIPLNIKKNELYDDDIIFVKHLDKSYKVKLYDYDEIKYYPHLI